MTVLKVLCLIAVLSIESGTKEGWMPVEDMTSSIDRYQSSHSAAGVPGAFAMGAPARPVRPQTYGVRPQSHGAPAQTPPAHSVRPAAPKFNQSGKHIRSSILFSKALF